MFINYRGEKIVYYRNTDFNQFFDVYMAGVTLPNPTYKVEYLNRKTTPFLLLCIRICNLGSRIS